MSCGLRVATLSAVALIVAACSAATTSSTPGPSGTPAGETQSQSVAPTADILSNARLQGTYVVTRTVTKETGFAFRYTVGQVENRVYVAVPVCAAGPCDSSVVVTTPRQAKTATVVFRWVAGTFTYDETDIASGWVCNKGGTVNPVKEALTHTELHPSDAQVIDGMPVATKFLITLSYEVHQSDAGTQAGCAAFSVDRSGTIERTDDASAVIAGVSTSGGPRPASDVTPDESCSKEATARATASAGTVSFKIDNKTTAPLTLFYLDVNGKRQKQADIAEGAGVIQESTKTQPWVVADPSGRCLLLVDGGAETFTIQ